MKGQWMQKERRNTGGASKQHQIGVQISFNKLSKMYAAQKSGQISTAC